MDVGVAKDEEEIDAGLNLIGYILCGVESVAEREDPYLVTPSLVRLQPEMLMPCTPSLYQSYSKKFPILQGTDPRRVL